VVLALEVPAAPSSPGVLVPLVASEAPDVAADVGSPEVGAEAPADVVSELVDASPEVVAGGFGSAVVSLGVTAAPEVGCESAVVGDDRSVDVEPPSGVAVVVGLGTTVESIASCVVVVESTGVVVDVGGVPVPVAVAVSSVVPTDPRSARAVAAMSAAPSIQQASVATTVSRKPRRE
jgi:hypothetical protein